MELTRKQFDVLEVLATTTNSLTQRELEKYVGYSLGTINRIWEQKYLKPMTGASKNRMDMQLTTRWAEQIVIRRLAFRIGMVKTMKN